MEEKTKDSTPRQKWRKVAYGGMQPGYDDNHTDESFLEDMVMNANVVKRDMLKVMRDSVSISQYLCIVALVVCIWTYTLGSKIDETSLIFLDVGLLVLGFLVLLLTAQRLSLQLLFRYILNISFFISGLYVLAPVYYTLTRSISSDSIWALTASLLTVHLFLHDDSGSTIRPPGGLNNPTFASNISLNASIVASVLIASRLPSRLHVFSIMLLFTSLPLCTTCHVLHKEIFFQAAFLGFIATGSCCIGHRFPTPQAVVCSIFGSVDLHYHCLSLLAHKVTGIQVRDKWSLG